MDQNCDVIWAFDAVTKNIITFADTNQWEDWYRQNKKLIKAAEIAQTKAVAKSNAARAGLSYKEKLEFEKIEGVIAEEEAALQKMQAELDLSDTQSNYTKLSELTRLISEAETKIERLFARWDELTKKNNGAS
jgi:ATP-binding cassette subfamily F protein uup